MPAARLPATAASSSAGAHHLGWFRVMISTTATTPSIRRASKYSSRMIKNLLGRGELQRSPRPLL